MSLRRALWACIGAVAVVNAESVKTRLLTFAVDHLDQQSPSASVVAERDHDTSFELQSEAARGMASSLARGMKPQASRDASHFICACETPRGTELILPNHQALASSHLHYELPPLSDGKLRGGVRPPFGGDDADPTHPTNDRFDYVTAAIPADATKVTLRHWRFGQVGSHVPSARRSMEAAANGIVLTPVQVVGSNQVTLTFLSAGYQKEADFRKAVLSMQKVLYGLNKAVNAGPYSRYASTLNMYSVFEPSEKKGGDGDNLGCKQWDRNQLAHRLSCDFSLINSLGSNGPVASDVFVVLVNTETYGGTGVAGTAVLSAENKDAAFLLIHELNHALVGLGDEYSYGYADESGMELPNCAKDRLSPLWATDFPELGAATEGCSFSNLNRPTENQCLMREQGNPMCPVCAQAASFALRKKRTSGTITSLAAPRCPPTDFALHVQPGESVLLSVNGKLKTSVDGVKIQWSRDNSHNPSWDGLSQVSIDKLGVGRHTFKATVNDEKSPYVKANPGDNFKSVETFIVEVSSAGAPQTITCAHSDGTTRTIGGKCSKSSGTCDLKPVVTPVSRKVDSTVSIETAQWGVIITAVLLALLGLAAIIFAVVMIVRRFNAEPHEVLVIGTCEKVVWWATMVFLFIAFLLCVVLIALLVYGVRKVPIFALDIFIAFFVLACILYLIVAFTFCCVVAWYGIPMVIGGVILVLFSIGIFVLGAVAVYAVVNNKTTALTSRYKDLWKKAVEKKPEYVCGVQQELQCSGFDVPCAPLPEPGTCPSHCDTGNSNQAECLFKWQDFVADTLRPVAGVALTFAFVLLIGGALAVILQILLDRIRDNARSRRTYRKDPRAPIASLTHEETAMLAKQFEKADRNETGTLDADELVKFCHRVFPGEIDSGDEADLRRACEDERGHPIELTLDETLDLLFPARHRKADPRLLTDREAQQATDMQDMLRMQDRKMQKYMEACGTLSPEQLSRLYNAFLDPSADPDAAPDAATMRREANMDPSEVFLQRVRRAAEAHQETDEALMCNGLTPQELEGLRCQWVELHPDVHGMLTPAEVDEFYRATHNSADFVSQEHAQRWREQLDVRGTGQIGWPEFCFPFAQRALLRGARRKLESHGTNVMQEFGPENESQLLTREEVARDYGPEYVDIAFMPMEQAIPAERVAAAAQGHGRRH